MELTFDIMSKSLHTVVSLNFEFVFFFILQEALKEEVKVLEGRVSSIQEVLGDLKVQLYAKFGNNINLEADES